LYFLPLPHGQGALRRMASMAGYDTPEKAKAASSAA
jgi:hypothetical protein